MTARLAGWQPGAGRHWSRVHTLNQLWLKLITLAAHDLGSAAATNLCGNCMESVGFCVFGVGVFSVWGIPLGFLQSLVECEEGGGGVCMWLRPAMTMICIAIDCHGALTNACAMSLIFNATASHTKAKRVVLLKSRFIIERIIRWVSWVSGVLVITVETPINCCSTHRKHDWLITDFYLLFIIY